MTLSPMVTTIEAIGQDVVVGLVKEDGIVLIAVILKMIDRACQAGQIIILPLHPVL